MPDFYAHQTFGNMVLKELRLPLSGSDRAAWECGVYGPDPLFFSLQRRISDEGHALHNEAPGAALRRLYLNRAKPQVAAYASGYLCHYMLDMSCHPAVETFTGGGTWLHLITEHYFDRFLMRDHASGRPAGETERQPVLEAAACLYETADAEAYRAALHTFCRLSEGAAAVRRRMGVPEKYLGICEVLWEQMREAVPVCCRQLTLLQRAFRGDGNLDFLPELNFYGQQIPGK